LGGRQAGSAPLNRRARNVDEYIDLAAEELQGKPRGIRATIREAAPDAKEGINYMIPAYTLNGPWCSSAFSRSTSGSICARR